jgi:serine/threonine-protein kinase
VADGEDKGQYTYEENDLSQGGETRPAPDPAVPRLPAGGTVKSEEGLSFEVVRSLGEGGMGEVYLARQMGAEGFSSLVALKCVAGDEQREEDAKQRFVSEAKISSRFEHSGLVKAQNLVRIEGRLYLVLEYVDGTSLRVINKTAAELGRRLPVELGCYIGQCVAEALHYAHTLRGGEGEEEDWALVHRDVSANNVMVTKQGFVKLLDFGVAYARVAHRERTRTGLICGNYAYLSPEQAAGRRPETGEIDRRSDLFSLGLLLVEMLRGERVFEAPDDYQYVRAIAECSRERVLAATADLPPGLREICQRLLEKRREDRYQTADEVAQALHDALGERGVSYGPRECVASLVELGVLSPSAAVASRTASVRAYRRRRRLRYELVAATALVVGAGLGLWTGLVVPRWRAPAASPIPAASNAGTATAGAPRAAGPPLEPGAGDGSPAAGSALAPAAERGPVAPMPAPTVSEPSANAATPVGRAERFDWPGGVPVRKKRAAGAAKTPETTPAVSPADAAIAVAPQEAPNQDGHVAEPAATRDVGANVLGHLSSSPDGTSARQLTATLPRGSVLHARLLNDAALSRRGLVEGIITEEATAGNTVVPKGATVTCHTGSVTGGRIELLCNEAKSGEQTWEFNAVAVGEDDRTGLHLVDGRVPSGTRFAVYVTTSAVVE